MWRIPPRRQEPELLDGHIDNIAELRANLGDMALANQLLGSNRAVIRRVADWLSQVPGQETPTILDVATGAGGLPYALARWARRNGKQMRLVASDYEPVISRIAAAQLGLAGVGVVTHDAIQMPFGDNSIDIVTCAFALHHLQPEPAVALLREMARVARIGVIVSDLRRSYGAYWGARLLGLATINRLSRHDGPLSVLRAYTVDEAQALVAQAGIAGTACAEPFFRVALVFHKHRPLA